LALVSVENGTKVVKSFWLETKEESTDFSFIAEKNMTPNIFINVSLIQPHNQAINDLPIRLYGVLGLKIIDKESKLEPVIVMPDEIRSESQFNLKVSEKNKKPMTYVIAIVDEGLLDLTNFKTPDPWNVFNAREALGVKTWDTYDWVIGSFAGEIGKLLNIGGDDEIKPEGEHKANRFKPVVKFIGPFYLDENTQKTHKITLPQYIGSVRTMVIAKNNKAYGSAEKATKVTKPLMLLASLPRVLGPEESVRMQVEVFAMQDNLKKVNIEIKTNDLVEVAQNSKSLSFSEPGEKSSYFDLKVKSKTGIANIEIIASSGKETTKQNIEIEIRNPNLPITSVLTKILEPGEKWQASFSPIGVLGTNIYLF